MSPLSKSTFGAPGVLLPDEEEDDEPASGHDQADHGPDGSGPGLVILDTRQTDSPHFSFVSDLTGPPVGRNQAAGTPLLQDAPRGAAIADTSTSEPSADGAAPVLETTLSPSVDSQDRQLLEALPAASGGASSYVYPATWNPLDSDFASSPNGSVSYQCGVVSNTVGQTSDIATSKFYSIETQYHSLIFCPSTGGQSSAIASPKRPRVDVGWCRVFNEQAKRHTQLEQLATRKQKQQLHQT